MDDVKPCPFCGGIGIIDDEIAADGSKRCFVRCQSCAAEGGWAHTPKGALTCWNMRTTA